VENQRGAILQRNFIFGLAAVRRRRLVEEVASTVHPLDDRLGPLAPDDPRRLVGRLRR
jgi:hypothetical protein